MIFSKPIPFRDALQSREVRSILATTLSSEQLAQIDSAILERSLFSARVTNAEHLQKIQDVIDAYLKGKIDFATARLELKKKLDEIGYAPAAGDQGTLRDFSSDERTNLVIRMNSEMARGYGTWTANQSPAVLDAWPAQELIRVAPRVKPRTTWHERFVAAGGQIFEDRMIALRNTNVWTKLSRFDLPYPPFDFNSGMGTRLVTRATAMNYGLIDRATQIAPQSRGFNDDLKYTADLRSAFIRQALEEYDYAFTDDGALTLGGGN